MYRMTSRKQDSFPPKRVTSRGSQTMKKLFIAVFLYRLLGRTEAENKRRQCSVSVLPYPDKVILPSRLSHNVCSAPPDDSLRGHLFIKREKAGQARKPA